VSPNTLLRSAADRFIAAANAFDAAAAQALFTTTAIIDDPSTGMTFVGHAGVRDYVQRYFIGYATVTRLMSLKQTAEHQAIARVDFTGAFGHEIGRLVITLGSRGLIARIDAELE
jgi:hypothetical protein